jgi:integrase
MKTTTPQKHHIETKFGRVRAYEKMKARSRWKNPGVPEFERNWFLRFHCGGETWDEMAGPAYPVADGIKALKTYVETVMEVRLQAAREGKLDRLREVVAPSRVLWLSEVIALHEQHAPKSEHSRKSRQRLAAIWREVLGLEPEEVQVCPKIWSKANLDAWVRMRQASVGWLEKKVEQKLAAMSDDERTAFKGKIKVEVDWAELRADYKAGKLPAKDKVHKRPVNTTIVGYLSSAKSVFAEGGEYLPRLVLPDLTEFRKYEAGVRVTKGLGEMPPEVLQRVIEGLPALKAKRLDAWTLLQVAAWTAVRTASLKRMNRSSITWMEDGTAKLAIPETKDGNAVVARVPQEVAEALHQLANEDGLFGRSHGGVDRLRSRELNPWLRKMGLEGSQALYRFRGHQLQATRDALGLEQASALAGHKDMKTTATYYAKRAPEVPMVDWQTSEVRA